MLTVRLVTSSILFTAVAAMLGGGCVTDDGLEEQAAAPGIDLRLQAREIAGPRGPLTEVEIPGDEPVTIEGGVCACQSAECTQAFVRDNFGEGVCVTFRCGDQRVGSCAPPARRRDVLDLAAAEVERRDHADIAMSAAAAAPPSMLAPAPTTPAIDLVAIGTDCSDARTCSAGLTCTAGGMVPDEQAWSCELACPLGSKQCPSGTACVTISDGPGPVCRAL